MGWLDGVSGAQGKTAKAAGETIKDPYAKQDEGFAQEEAEKQKYLAGLNKQVAAKQATAKQFDTQIAANKHQQESAIGQQRRKAAQQLAGLQARSMGGGGAMLLLGNQAALDAGRAEADLASKFGAEREQLGLKQKLAEEAAAGAETEAAAERRKMLDVDRGYDKAVTAAIQEYRKRIAGKGWIFSSDEDKAQVAEEIASAYAATLPPAQRAEFMRQLQAEMQKDVEGKWDI